MSDRSCDDLPLAEVGLRLLLFMLEKLVPLKHLPHAEGLDLPSYATSQSAGMDLRAAVAIDEPVCLEPGDRALIPTGIQIALPDGLEGQVRPRSGLAVRFGITVLNSPGTIDSDYRGEIKVILINHGQESFTVERGERIAQLVIGAYGRIAWDAQPELKNTLRGAGGFGHTGR